MKKTLFIIGIVVLFIGMTAFTGATNIETKTVEQPPMPAVVPYPYAAVALHEGGVLYHQEPDSYYKFPLQLPDGTFFIIASGLTVNVSEGKFTVIGAFAWRETTIVPNGGNVTMSLFFGRVIEKDEATYTLFLGRAVWVVIEWPS